MAYYKITFQRQGETEEQTLFQPGTDYCLLSCKLSIGMGKSGSLTMEIPALNPARDDIDCLTDEIIFYRNNVELWRGRAVTVQNDFNRTGTIECEGILAYLYDTWYPPYDFQGSPNDLLADVLAQHNAMVEERKRIYVGTITVTDNNDYIARSNQDYSRSLDVLIDKLVGESLGGYLRVRYANNKRYLDYLDNYGGTASQTIEFGSNLLDIAVDIEYGNIVTAILPLGAEVEPMEDAEDSDSETTTPQRITVESVNNGSPYVSDAQAVAQYGWIADCVTWDDVTLPENLLQKAMEYLSTVTNGLRTVTVKAVDLAQIDTSMTSIFLGDAVHIVSTPHGIDTTAELTEMEIDPLNPDQNTLTFGTTERLTDTINRNQSDVVTMVQTERKYRQTAIERLQKAIGEGSGLYITPDKQADGSDIYYLHDLPELSASTYVIRVNSQSIAFSTDGGVTYPFGFTVDGALVMDIIEANGISSDWVKFGSQTMTEKITENTKAVEDLRTEFTVETGKISAEITEVKNGVDEANAAIEELPGKINLSVSNGQLGSKASIKLSVDGKASTAEIDMTKARQAFADDTSEVAVSAGKITYNAGTLVINAGNFTLDADGNMTATNGTFGGTITATSGSIGGLQVATTSDSTQHTYGNSIYTQTINVTENVWNHSEGDNATKTVYLDTEFGIKPVTSLGSLSSYLIAKPHSTANWTNDLILYSVSGRGAVKCSGLTVYPRRPLEYNDGEITYTDSEFACIETDNEYMTLNNVKFVTGGIGGIYSDMDPGKSNAYDMGGASYYWRAIYVKTVHRSSESNLSDRRQKKDIIPLPEDYRSFVLRLTPVQYRWREDGDRLHAGFIAQDVAAAAQSTVGDCGVWQVWDRRTDDDVSLHYADTPEDDQIWSYSPDEILSPLVAVVQQQDQRISTMEDTISQLTQRLAALEHKLTGGEV